MVGIQGGKTVRHQARITIAADGANSVIARALHPQKMPHRCYGVAMRAYFSGVYDLDQYVEFDLTRPPSGYGWLFPVGNGLANIGIGLRLDVCCQSSRHLLQAFDEFIKNHAWQGGYHMLR